MDGLIRNFLKNQTNEILKLKTPILKMKKYILDLNKILEKGNKNVSDVESRSIEIL